MTLALLLSLLEDLQEEVDRDERRARLADRILNARRPGANMDLLRDQMTWRHDFRTTPFYHVTTADRARAILREGLRSPTWLARREGRPLRAIVRYPGVPLEHVAGRVFLAQGTEAIREWAWEMSSSSNASINRKRTPRNEAEMLVAIQVRNTPWLRARLHVDEESWNPRSFWVNGTIPASELSVDIEETDFLNRAFAFPVNGQ